MVNWSLLVVSAMRCRNLDTVKGTVIGHRDGYGFLRVEGRKDDLYLSSEQMKTCIHGDQVLAQPLGADRKGRREARIVRVLVPKPARLLVATLPKRASALWFLTIAV